MTLPSKSLTRAGEAELGFGQLAFELSEHWFTWARVKLYTMEHCFFGVSKQKQKFCASNLHHTSLDSGLGSGGREATALSFSCRLK